MKKFIRKFDVNHIDGDPLYGHTLGGILIVAGWVTIGSIIYAISHQYWTMAFAVDVWNDTVINFMNSYVH